MRRELLAGLIAVAAHVLAFVVGVEYLSTDPRPDRPRVAATAISLFTRRKDPPTPSSPQRQPAPKKPAPAPERPEAAPNPASGTDEGAAPDARPAADARAAPMGSSAAVARPLPATLAAHDEPTWDRYVAALHRSIAAHRRYNARARRLGLQGQVELLLELHPDGTLVGHPAIARSSGHALLDDEALRMVERALPLPAFPPGRTENALVRVPIGFSLAGESRQSD